MAILIPFSQISKGDIPVVGGKGASLGELKRAGFPVPDGFVITTEAYRKFSGGEIPQNAAEEILSFFDNLGASRVAVRSSAIAEDSSLASWAGQFESYLNVSRKDLVEKIAECWNSVRSDRVKSYFESQNVSADKMAMAVVVQKMVDSDVAGVMFTVNPVAKDDEEIMIEAGFGLGEILVQGMISPDNYVIKKDTLAIKDKIIKEKNLMMVYDGSKTEEVDVPPDMKNKASLTDDQAVELALMGRNIEKHYGAPQDIEWAYENNIIYILQSRPITTL